jgi:hypothetical protein
MMGRAVALRLLLALAAAEVAFCAPRVAEA